MKKIVWLCLIPLLLFAQDEASKSTTSTKGSRPWEFGVNSSALFSMNTYSNSWAGSEQATMAWNIDFIGTINKQFITHLRWENILIVRYGQSKIQEASSVKDERGNWAKWHPSTDEIDYQTFGLITLQRVLDPYISSRLQTTFHNQIATNKQVQYFNPLSINEGAGVRTELFKGNEKQSLKMALGGVFYQHVNRKIDTTYLDGGFEFITSYSVSWKEDILVFNTYLNLYQAVVVSENRPNDAWKTLDIQWKNQLDINVLKYLKLSYSNELLYDREVSEKARFRQMLSAGATFVRRNKAREEYLKSE